MRYRFNPRGNKNNSSAGGLSNKDSFYHVFARIRARCDYPKNPDYKRYGGRGIKFEWCDYPSFKEDMYTSYLLHKKENGPDNTTLERIDNNGNYCKENCRWATWKEQSKNKRTSRYITYGGRTMIIADWARELGVHRQTLRYRLESGWGDEQTIEISINYANKVVPTPR